jgi:hypothetical protein
MFLLTVLCSL